MRCPTLADSLPLQKPKVNQETSEKWEQLQMVDSSMDNILCPYRQAVKIELYQRNYLIKLPRN